MTSARVACQVRYPALDMFRAPVCILGFRPASSSADNRDQSSICLPGNRQKKHDRYPFRPSLHFLRGFATNSALKLYVEKSIRSAPVRFNIQAKDAIYCAHAASTNGIINMLRLEYPYCVMFIQTILRNVHITCQMDHTSSN